MRHTSKNRYGQRIMTRQLPLARRLSTYYDATPPLQRLPEETVTGRVMHKLINRVGQYFLI